MRQYLSESFKQTHLPGGGGRQANSLGASMMATNMSRTGGTASGDMKSHSLEYGLQPGGGFSNTPTPSSSGTNNHQPFYFSSSRLGSVTASPSECGAMSPSISSVVTSGSEVSSVWSEYKLWRFICMSVTALSIWLTDYDAFTKI